MTTLLVATRNAHKVQEISQILGGKFRCLSLNDFPGAPAAVEDAETFAGNAALKARCLAIWLAQNPEKHKGIESPFYILADDSGLEVDALAGAPGVHSARFAAEDAAGSANAPDSANNAKLLRLLDSVPPGKRIARFRCALAMVRLDEATGKIEFFDGACEGRIDAKPAGKGGFGYDPLFIPAGYQQSFAELGEEIKNGLSHRAAAVKKLRSYLGEE